MEKHLRCFSLTKSADFSFLSHWDDSFVVVVAVSYWLLSPIRTPSGHRGGWRWVSPCPVLEDRGRSGYLQSARRKGTKGTKRAHRAGPRLVASRPAEVAVLPERYLRTPSRGQPVRELGERAVDRTPAGCDSQTHHDGAASAHAELRNAQCGHAGSAGWVSGCYWRRGARRRGGQGGAPPVRGEHGTALHPEPTEVKLAIARCLLRPNTCQAVQSCQQRQ